MPALWVDKRLTHMTEHFYDVGRDMIIISRRWVCVFTFILAQRGLRYLPTYNREDYV